MAERRGGGGWSLVVFFGLWTALALWWLLGAPSQGTAVTIVKVLVLIPGLLGLAVAIILAVIIGKLGGVVRGFQEELAKGMGPEIDDAANKILDMQTAVWGGPHDFRAADPGEFPELDRSYYDDTQRWLEGHGFRFLADIENTTLTNVFPQMRTFLRVMLGDEDATAAAVYQVRRQAPEAPAQEEGAETDDAVRADEAAAAPDSVYAVDFETELTDGTFLVTNSLAESDRMPEMEGIDKLRLPRETPPDEVLTEHRNRVAAARASGKAVRTLATFQDVADSQNRMHAIKCAHQRRIGYLDEQTLEGISGKSVFGDKLVARVRELYAQRQARGEAPNWPPVGGEATSVR